MGKAAVREARASVKAFMTAGRNNLDELEGVIALSYSIVGGPGRPHTR